MTLLGRRSATRRVRRFSTSTRCACEFCAATSRCSATPTEFSIYDLCGDQESIAPSALRDIRVGQDHFGPATCSIIGTWKTHSVRRSGWADRGRPQAKLAAVAYERYQAALKDAALSISRLLLLTEQLFDQFPEARYRRELPLRPLLIASIRHQRPAVPYRQGPGRRNRNLCVVGDDDSPSMAGAARWSPTS